MYISTLYSQLRKHVTLNLYVSSFLSGPTEHTVFDVCLRQVWTEVPVSDTDGLDKILDDAVETLTYVVILETGTTSW